MTILLPRILLILVITSTNFFCSGDGNMETDDLDSGDQTSSDDTTPNDVPDTNDFTMVSRITPSGIEAGDFFGYSIASNNEFTAVSAPFDDELGQRTGKVYVFRRSGKEFEDIAEVIYNPEPTQEDYFGWSLSLSGETLAVGAPRNDKNGNNAGMAYIFQHSGDNEWELMKEIEPSNSQEGQEFGDVISLDDHTLAVSARFDEDNYFDEGGINNGGGHAQGSVYLYDGNTDWQFVQKLIPEEGQGDRWDAFGASLSMNNGILAIGAPGTDNTTYRAPGSVYLFEKTGSMWEQSQRIEASDGWEEDFFGSNLDLQGNDLAITAPGSFNSFIPNANRPHGAAYIFNRQEEVWSENGKLLAEDSEPDDGFGSGGVSFNQDYLFVGAPFTRVVTNNNGIVYAFERLADWSESHSINANDPLNEDSFGFAISATDDLLFVGAHTRCNETGCIAGALYFVE